MCILCTDVKRVMSKRNNNKSGFRAANASSRSIFNDIPDDYTVALTAVAAVAAGAQKNAVSAPNR